MKKESKQRYLYRFSASGNRGFDLETDRQLGADKIKAYKAQLGHDATHYVETTRQGEN